jgi:hypothetical protein
MQAFIALKRGPLHLLRDSVTRLFRYRLDSAWFIPSFLRGRFALHAEIVIVKPCPGRCNMCVRADLSETKYQGIHYLTYSVDNREQHVYRSIGRHITPPEVIADNDESWMYYRLPMSQLEIQQAIDFLEGQLDKPIAPFMRRFLCSTCCVAPGARFEDHQNRFENVQAWFCSELASAMLLCCCSAFFNANTWDPGEITPCRLETLLQRTNGVTRSSAIQLFAVA